MKSVSIIIVNFNGIAYTRKCLESLFRFHPADDLDVIVVDNHSHDGSVDALKSEFPNVNVIAMTENRGFGSANNAGAKSAKADVLFFVNNDTLFVEETVSTLASHLTADEKIGIVGPKLLNDDRSFQLSFGRFPSIISEYKMKQLMNDTEAQKRTVPAGVDDVPVDWVTGAAFMIQKSLYDAVGGFDEKFFLYFEDIDLNKRVRNSERSVVYCPSVQMVHFGGRSYGEMNPAVAFQYRRSQLHYYDTHTSHLERIILRCYLSLKYAAGVFKGKDRPLTARIYRMLWKRQ
ncbi:MAG: glycosyltransferase family 2 protein [Bacteroidota bacterium]